jgi:hypothetical protein
MLFKKIRKVNKVILEEKKLMSLIIAKRSYKKEQFFIKLSLINRDRGSILLS